MRNSAMGVVMRWMRRKSAVASCGSLPACWKVTAGAGESMRVVLGVDAISLLSEAARSFAASIFVMPVFRDRKNECFKS